MTKLRSLGGCRGRFSLAVLGALGLLACPAWVSAGVLGKAAVRTDGDGAVVIEIPVDASREALAVMATGARADAACIGCVAPVLGATLERPGGEVQSTLRITGAPSDGRPYLEFQAWVEWELDGRLSGDLRNYKVDFAGLPRLEKRLQQTEHVVLADATESVYRGQSVGSPEVNPVAHSAKRAGAVLYDAAAAKAEAERFVSNWLKAWSAKDMERYLGAYAEDFRVPAGSSRGDWEKERRQRILGRKGLLQVEFENLFVKSVSPERMEVRFVQKYRSAAYSSVGLKSILLVMRDGAWKIAAEGIEGEQPLSP